MRFEGDGLGVLTHIKRLRHTPSDDLVVFAAGLLARGSQ
jgi:hypothetical protein